MLIYMYHIESSFAFPYLYFDTFLKVNLITIEMLGLISRFLRVAQNP